MNEREATEFALRVLGRRFGCDFRVESVGPGETARLAMRGQLYVISLDELWALVDRGFVTELMQSREGT